MPAEFLLGEEDLVLQLDPGQGSTKDTAMMVSETNKIYKQQQQQQQQHKQQHHLQVDPFNHIAIPGPTGSCRHTPQCLHRGPRQRAGVAAA